MHVYCSDKDGHTEQQKYLLVALGLIIGAALGTILFVVIGPVWLVGAGIRLAIGAAIDAARSSRRGITPRASREMISAFGVQARTV